MTLLLLGGPRRTWGGFHEFYSVFIDSIRFQSAVHLDFEAKKLSSPFFSQNGNAYDMESIYTNRICHKRTLGRPWGNLFLDGNAQGAFAGRIPTEVERAIWYG